MSQYITTTGARRRRGGALSQIGLGALDIVLGAVGLGDAEVWSVKAYAGGVWGSYHSPATNAALIKLQTDLGMLGQPVTPNGLIGASTVKAVNTITSRAMGAPLSTVTGTGRRVFDVGKELRMLAGGANTAYTAQAIAQPAVGALISDLAHSYYQESSPWWKGATTSPPKTTTPKTSGGNTVVVAPPADAPPPPDGSGFAETFTRLSSTQKMALGAAAMVAGVMVARGGKRKGKKRGGRS